MIEQSRTSRDVSNEIGQFGLGLWYQGPNTPPLSWKSVEVGMPLGPFDWTLESYEIAIICYCAEIKEAHYLASKSNPVPILPPTGAFWASIGLLYGHFSATRGADIAHEIQWYRTMRAGEPTRISGRIADKYVKRGLHYISWETHCVSMSKEPIFDVKQTVLDISEGGVHENRSL
jgi:hypothetical protein